MARAEPVDRVRGPLQGPLRHDVGVRIVIHGLMVLIRTDDRSNVIPPVWLYPATSGPESRGFDENVHAGCEEKILIRRRLPILPDRIGDIRADMVLLDPGEHLN